MKTKEKDYEKELRDNMYLVCDIVKEIVALDDKELVKDSMQSGKLALYNALSEYDENSKISFKKFAKEKIYRAVNNAIIKNFNGPGQLALSHNRITKQEIAFFDEYGYIPTPDELAIYMNTNELVVEQVKRKQHDYLRNLKQNESVGCNNPIDELIYNLGYEELVKRLITLGITKEEIINIVDDNIGEKDFQKLSTKIEKNKKLINKSK